MSYTPSPASYARYRRKRWWRVGSSAAMAAVSDGTNTVISGCSPRSGLPGTLMTPAAIAIVASGADAAGSASEATYTWARLAFRRRGCGDGEGVAASLPPPTIVWRDMRGGTPTLVAARHPASPAPTPTHVASTAIKAQPLRGRGGLTAAVGCALVAVVVAALLAPPLPSRARRPLPFTCTILRRRRSQQRRQGACAAASDSGVAALLLW